MMKVDPFPGVLVAVIMPPCRFTIFRQMARPMPVKLKDRSETLAVSSRYMHLFKQM